MCILYHEEYEHRGQSKVCMLSRICLCIKQMNTQASLQLVNTDTTTVNTNICNWYYRLKNLCTHTFLRTYLHCAVVHVAEIPLLAKAEGNLLWEIMSLH